MAIQPYGIGNTPAASHVNPAFAGVSQNRTLLAAQFTLNGDPAPEIITGLTTLEKVFAHYKPTAQVELDTESGLTRREVFRFRSIDDFNPTKITERTALLQQFKDDQLAYHAMLKLAASNGVLQDVLLNVDRKQALLSTIDNMLEKLAG